MIKESDFCGGTYLLREDQAAIRRSFLNIKEKINEQFSADDLMYNCIWSSRGNLQNKILFYLYVLENIPNCSTLELISLELKEPLEKRGYTVFVKHTTKPIASVFLGAIYRSIFGILIRRIHFLDISKKYEGVTTLVDSFLTPQSLSTGVYLDRNFGSFDKGDRYVYLVTNLIPSGGLYKCSKYIRKSPDLLLDDYFLNTFNHIRILYKYVKRYLRPNRVSGIYFRGYDISEIINNQIKQSNGDISCYKAIKKGYALDRLFRQMPNVSVVYDWNENQNIDRSLISVSREHQINVKAVRQYFADLNNLELYFTALEHKHNCLPSLVLDVTERHSVLYNQVKSGIMVVLTPYYRQFQKLSFNPFRNALLVVLPNGLKASTSLLELVNRANLRDLQIFVRCHPTYSKAHFSEYIEEYKWIDKHQEFYELANSISHILTTGTSFLVEAVNSGLNVANFKSNVEISYVPLDLYHDEAITTIESVVDLEKWILKKNNDPIKLDLFLEC